MIVASIHWGQGREPHALCCCQPSYLRWGSQTCDNFRCPVFSALVDAVRWDRSHPKDPGPEVPVYSIFKYSQVSSVYTIAFVWCELRLTWGIWFHKCNTPGRGHEIIYVNVLSKVPCLLIFFPSLACCLWSVGFSQDVEFITFILLAFRDSGPFLEYFHLILIAAPHPPYSL